MDTKQYCKHCYRMLAESAAFCPNCGQPQTDYAKQKNTDSANQSQEPIQKGKRSASVGFNPNSTFVQGLFGNLTEISVDVLTHEFGQYLMKGEFIQTGFKLIRDAMVITNYRIISFDKQGATGQKMRVDSIYLSSIYHVTAETAGFGLDDCELEIDYIATPYHKAHGLDYKRKKYEFPKRYNIQGLYNMLQEIAYENYTRLNSLP